MDELSLFCRFAKSIAYQAFRVDGRFQGVEENLAWTMKFPSGVVASCITTYGASMPGYYKVYGSKGWLEVDEFGYSGLHGRRF